MKPFLALLAFVIVSAAQGQVAGVRAENVWVFAVPPGAEQTAAFMTLVNAGTATVRLTGARSPAAGRLAPMVTTKDGGRLGMKDVPALEIPPGGRLTLAPGGDHLMLYALKGSLTVGAKIPLVLEFTPGGTLAVEALVSKRRPE